MKNIFLISPTIFLCFVSAYTALVYIDNGYYRNEALIALLGSLFVHFLYFIWLTTTKRIGTKLAVFYIPIALVLFIVFAYSIMYPPYKRGVRLDLGPDPFSADTSITGFTEFYFWQKGFYFPKKVSKEVAEEEKIRMQVTRQGSLIGHVGNDLFGWSEEKIETAFGVPSDIVVIDSNLEKWMYHPWTNHPDWEMPVYIQNNTLFKIGD